MREPRQVHRSSCGSGCVPHLRGSELWLVGPVLGAGCLVPTRPGSTALVTGCGWGHSPPRKKLLPPSLCSVELFAQRPPGEVSRLTPAGRSPLSGMGTGPPCPGPPALAQETLPSLVWPLQGPGQVLRSLGDSGPSLGTDQLWEPGRGPHGLGSACSPSAGDKIPQPCQAHGAVEGGQGSEWDLDQG